MRVASGGREMNREHMGPCRSLQGSLSLDLRNEKPVESLCKEDLTSFAKVPLGLLC